MPRVSNLLEKLSDSDCLLLVIPLVANEHLGEQRSRLLVTAIDYGRHPHTCVNMNSILSSVNNIATVEKPPS